MAQRYTVDASVFLNSLNPHEAGHAESRRCLEWLRDAAAPITVPMLLLPEVSAAIARGRGDPLLSQLSAARVQRLPHLVLVPLDAALAQHAVAMAAQQHLRGSDAVYGAVAVWFGTTLISRDREQRERLQIVVPTVRPEDLPSPSS